METKEIAFDYYLIKKEAMYFKYTFSFILLLTTVLLSNGQFQSNLAVPNQFHGYKLGAPVGNFSLMSQKDSKDKTLILYSEIKTKNMKAYTLKNQLTEAGDKIDIDLFFYNDSLSVIRIAYKEPQSKKEILDAVKIKYGDDARLDDNLYNDPLSGATRIFENLYWEKSSCCVLNLTATDEIGLVYLTFAEKNIQAKLKKLELMNNQRRIN
jgi:hypothetical protein